MDAGVGFERHIWPGLWGLRVTSTLPRNNLLINILHSYALFASFSQQILVAPWESNPHLPVYDPGRVTPQVCLVTFAITRRVLFNDKERFAFLILYYNIFYKTVWKMFKLFRPVRTFSTDITWMDDSPWGCHNPTIWTFPLTSISDLFLH